MAILYTSISPIWANTHWLLDLNIVGADGHWLRSLDLLFNDLVGRHLELATISFEDRGRQINQGETYSGVRVLVDF